PFCRRAVPDAARVIKKLGGTVIADPDTAGLLRGPVSVTAGYSALAQEVDVLLVFGGDGTMLRIGRDTAGSGTPMFGINTGHLGFLTAVDFRQIPEALKQIAAGTCNVVNRALIAARGRVGGKPFRLPAM